MPARVLIVDDDPTALKELEARLSAEYFDVATATDGSSALAAIAEDTPDIVLLDLKMPDVDGAEVCERLRGDDITAHVPVVMITVDDRPESRVRALEAGADDLLVKPVDDTLLLARIRALVRSKLMTDEFLRREQTSSQLGVMPAGGSGNDADVLGARILIIDDAADADRVAMGLANTFQVTVEPDPDRAMAIARTGDFELIVVSLELANSDGLRLCSHLRTMEETRQTGIVVIVTPGATERIVRSLEIGVSAFVVKPVIAAELLARARIVIGRKMHQDRLRANYEMSLALAVTDSLTGLHNRRYMVSHLDTLLRRALESDRPVSLLLLDIDHFKEINDTHGHAVGDEVLVEFAERIRRGVRGIDLAVRYGGEEFVVVLPETDRDGASMVAERLRRHIADETFRISGGAPLDVTVSIGVAVYDGSDASADSLIKRADDALYRAKNGGRNQVVAA
jgi:two-component system cell cycle response regulator